jgi:hypothetical protein
VQLVGRVTRWVREKISQNVAQPILCQNSCIALTVEKIAPKYGLLTYVCCFHKLPKVINHPMGENSPNLVTLLVGLNEVVFSVWLQSGRHKTSSIIAALIGNFTVILTSIKIRSRQTSTEIRSRQTSTEIRSRQTSTEMRSRQTSTEIRSRQTSTEMRSRQTSTEIRSRQTSTEMRSRQTRWREQSNTRKKYLQLTNIYFLYLLSVEFAPAANRPQIYSFRSTGGPNL